MDSRRRDTSIIYSNPDHTILILDIPSSIEVAQTLKNARNCSSERRLYSIAVKHPYPSPPEPKTDAARARVLMRIPNSEKNFLEDIDNFVKAKLSRLYKERDLSGNWCYQRRCQPEEEASEGPEKKRKLESELDNCSHFDEPGPPIILSVSNVNKFLSLSELQDVEVRNPASQAANIQVSGDDAHTEGSFKYTIPPKSSFILGNLSTSPNRESNKSLVIPGLPKSKKFNIILLDPPWPNRSVRRSSQYRTHTYLEMDSLVAIMKGIFLTHLDKKGNEKAIVGIWTTNSEKSRQAAYSALDSANLQVTEEWVWLKVTESGEPVVPLHGLWRKPYEILLIGTPKKTIESKDHKPLRRLIIAVPDMHSRKPNLKELFESLYFLNEELPEYRALEVFARSLTCGWYSCGNDVLRFNANQWWSEP